MPLDAATSLCVAGYRSGGFMGDVGAAGEHLVCADLFMNGFWASLTASGLPYDVVSDIRGRLIRIQVKATQKPKPPSGRPHKRLCYNFNIKKLAREPGVYLKCDLVALVAIDIKQIAYIPANQCPCILQIDGPNAEYQYPSAKGPRAGHRGFSDFPLLRALEHFI